METIDALQREIGQALAGRDFRRDAAGKSGEVLKIAVKAALTKARVVVELVSVGLALPETHPLSPYEAVWQRHPGAAAEKTYFDV